MNARTKPARRSALDRTADRAVFEAAIRDNLTPEAVATIIAYLQPADSRRPETAEQAEAYRQVRWLSDALTELVGGPTIVGELFDEMGL